MKPIYDHRRIVGYAKTAKQAQRILKGILSNVNKGWIIDVKERDTTVIDLPPGFVYSIRPR